jgi:hypothetical protein
VSGRENISHGRVGLRDVRGGGADTPADWFFDRSLTGDVVEAVGSRTARSPPATASAAGT